MVSGRLKRVERLLVGPATVIAEITAFVVFVLVALFAGIERILYSAYFLGCVTLCLLSLSAATIRMVARDVRVTRARKRAVIRGGTVLHIGLVLALVFSAAVLLGESQGIYVALEGETLPAGSAPVTLVRGPLAPPFVLPEAMTLLRVSPSWWDDGTLRQLSSELSLGSPARPVSLAVNGSRTISGVRYFQDQRFGPAYLLTLTGPDGSVQKRRVDLPQPDAGAPTYLDVQVADGVILRTRAESVSTHDIATILTVKMSRSGQESAPASISVGSTAQVDGWSVRLDASRTWAAYVVSREPPVWPLFASFLIVCAGAMMLYAVPPKGARGPLPDTEEAEDDRNAP